MFGFSSKPPSTEKLFRAAEKGDCRAIEKLLERGADINGEYNRWFAIERAAYRGHAEIVRLLIDKGADLDKSGLDALRVAKEKGHQTIVEILTPLLERQIRQKEERQQERDERAQQAAEKARQPVETWVMMGADKIARVGTYPEMQRKLTEIFNFISRERILITENLQLKTETMASPVSFDLTGEEALRQAFAAFTQNGGQVDEGSVFKYSRLPKQQLTKPGK